MAGYNESSTWKIPRFAIIIAVTHSTKCLEDCLKSLENLDYQKDLYHAVLIDCHVLPGLNEFFEQKFGEFNCQITTISLPEKPGNLKAWLHDFRNNEARNAAMQKVEAQYFVFTEDDCMFEQDWLTKFDAVLDENTGAVGGPDIIPEGMRWFPRALDCILSSFFGTAGMKRGDGLKKEWYYPRQHNTVIPARVFEKIGPFQELRAV